MGKAAKRVKARRHQAIIVSKFSRYKDEGYYVYPKRPNRGLLVKTNYEESAEVIVGILESAEGPNGMFNLRM